jgi:hypothetical protein
MANSYLERRSMAVLLSFGLMLLAASTASAQVALTVNGQRGISFGTLFRNGTSSISTPTTAMAEFWVVGRQKSHVRVTVSAANLTRTGGSITPSITNSDCYYSVDQGATWTAFNTGTLIQDVQLPTDTADGQFGTVRIRVGGSITAGSTQQRGDYTGSITVSASYK